MVSVFYWARQLLGHLWSQFEQVSTEHAASPILPTVSLCMIFLIKDSTLFQSLHNLTPVILCSFSTAILGRVTIGLGFRLFVVASIDRHPYLPTHPSRSSHLWWRLILEDNCPHHSSTYWVVELLATTSTHPYCLFYPSNDFRPRV